MRPKRPKTSEFKAVASMTGSLGPGSEAQPSPPLIVVREAVPADVPGIARVNELSGRPLGDPAGYGQAVADPERRVVVALLGSELAGWAKTHFWSHAEDGAPAGHYLGGVTVIPAVRRRGVGAQLTADRLEWIWNRSAEAWCVVNVCNAASIELHRVWGFVIVAEGARFHTTEFGGGQGFLMRAQRPIGYPNH